jgi:hypothetical protein
MRSGPFEHFGARLAVEALRDDSGKALLVLEEVGHMNAQRFVVEQVVLRPIERQDLGCRAIARKNRTARIDGHDSNRNGL